jgi:ABC-type branched-subunit amino acid transport system substrate-binding protein
MLRRSAHEGGNQEMPLLLQRLSTLFPALVLAGVAAFSNQAISQERGVTDTEIVIGTMNGLTGRLATYAVPIEAGTAAYFNMVNEAGGIKGRKVRLVSEDTASSPPQGLAAVRKMVSQDKIFALLNAGATPQVGAALPYLEQQKVPVFATYGGLIDWYNPPREGLYGIYVLGEHQAELLGKWAATDGQKKVVVLHIEGASYAKSALEVERGYKSVSGDGDVNLLGVKQPTSDYAPIVINIAQQKPDAIITMLSEPDSILLAKELHNQGMDIQLYAWAPIVSQKVIELGGPAVEGMKAVSMMVSPFDEAPAVQEYRAALEKYYPNEKPDYLSLYAFGAAKALTEAISRIDGVPTQEALYNALNTLDNYDGGIFPPMTFSKDRHEGLLTLFEAQVRNGHWEKGQVLSGAGIQ